MVSLGCRLPVAEIGRSSKGLDNEGQKKKESGNTCCHSPGTFRPVCYGMFEKVRVIVPVVATDGVVPSSQTPS